MLRPGNYRLTIGPSEVTTHAIDWYLVSIDPDGRPDSAGSDGWACPSSRHPDTVGGWVRRARQHGLIPRAVRTRDLEVKPLGWSPGGDRAPGGASIEFAYRVRT